MKRVTAAQGAIARTGRLSKAPRYIGPGWTLDERDKERFYRSYCVDAAIEDVGGEVHEEDREMLRMALAAQFGFHAFSDWIDTMEDFVGESEIADEIRDARVALELGLRAIDAALGDRHSRILRRSLEQADRRKDKPASDSMEDPRRNDRIRRYHRRLVEKGERAPVKQTAEEFGLTARQIRRIVHPGRS